MILRCNAFTPSWNSVWVIAQHYTLLHSLWDWSQGSYTNGLLVTNLIYSTDCAIFLCERAYSCWSWSLYCPGHCIFGCPVQMLSQKKVKESPLFWKGQDLSLVALYNQLILERLSYKRVKECTKLAKQPAKHSPSSLNADNLVFIALKCSVEWQWTSHWQQHVFALSGTLSCLLQTRVSLRNRMGEERRRQTLCDKCDNNFVWKTFPPNFTFL